LDWTARISVAVAVCVRIPSQFNPFIGVSVAVVVQFITDFAFAGMSSGLGILAVGIVGDISGGLIAGLSGV